MTMRHPLVRLVVTVPLCGALVAALVGAAWLALGKPSPVGATYLQITRVADSQYKGAPGEPFFFLALGNDSRSAGGQGLGDAIHVFGINPATGQGTVLNVPRDTEAPGGGKINAFHANGGLSATVDQLNRMMGININYAITTDFPGFMDMVNEIGGIEIDLPYDLKDEDAGADFRPGHYNVPGDGALSIARDRHDFTEGDIKRTENQSLIMLSALATLKARGYDNENGAIRLAAILVKHVALHNVNLTELYRLGRLALSLDPANIKNITIPVGGGSGTNLSVAPAAQALFADFRDNGVVGG